MRTEHATEQLDALVGGCPGAVMMLRALRRCDVALDVDVTGSRR